MKTLIVYDSRNGVTEDCAINIKKSLNCDTLYLRKQHKVVLDDYELIIIGSPIYMGQPLKRVKKFCNNNLNKLLNKQVAFFVCGLGDPKEMIAAFKKAIPEALINKAKVISHFGGELRPDKASFLEKMLLKKMLEDKKFNGKINEQEIITFINKVRM